MDEVTGSQNGINQIIDTGFRWQESSVDKKKSAEAFIYRERGEGGKQQYFQEPEYDIARVHIEKYYQDQFNKIVDFMVAKGKSQQIFSQEELDKITIDLDEGIADVIEWVHEDFTDDGEPDQESPVASDEDARQEEKRLIAAGWLRHELKNIRVEEDEETEDKTVTAELVTPGNELKHILEVYNDTQITREVGQGLEAKVATDQLKTAIIEKHPDFPEERLNQIIDGVQDHLNNGHSVGEAKLYWEIMKIVAGRNKLKMAEIVGLSVAETAINLGSIEAIGLGVSEGNFPLAGLGFLGIIGTQQVEVLRNKEIRTMMTETIEGKDGEGKLGLRNDLLRLLVTHAQDLDQIGAASLSLHNPQVFDAQIGRLQAVAESLPANLIPSLVNITSASAYLALRDPSWAAVLPGLLCGGALVAIDRRKASELAIIEHEKHLVQDESAKRVQELQAVASTTPELVDPQAIIESLQIRRKIADKAIKIETRYNARQLSAIGVLGGLRSLMGVMGANISTETLLQMANAQANEAMAIQRLAGSYNGIRRLLPPLQELYNEITAAREQKGRHVPDKHDSTFRGGVSYINEEGEPYLTVEDLEIQQGDKVLIEGESGSGKSQFFRLPFGNRPPDRGLMTIGQHTYKEIDIPKYRKNIAIKPQEIDTIEASLGINLGGVDYDPDIAADLLIESGLAEKLLNLDINKDSDLSLSRALVKVKMEEMKITSTFYKNSTGRVLSGGQRQMLGLLRVEYKRRSAQKEENPLKTIIIDEPFSDLDPNGVEYAQQLMDSWFAEEDLTIFFDDHRTEYKQRLRASGRVNRFLTAEKGVIRETKPE